MLHFKFLGIEWDFRGLAQMLWLCIGMLSIGTQMLEMMLHALGWWNIPILVFNLCYMATFSSITNRLRR